MPVFWGQVTMFRVSPSKSRRWIEYFSSTQRPHWDFLKCDVEGAELALVRGGRHSFKRYVPTILIEVNPAVAKVAGHSATEPLREIAALGNYEFFDVRDDGSPVHFANPDHLHNLAGYTNVLCVPRSRSDVLARMHDPVEKNAN